MSKSLEKISGELKPALRTLIQLRYLIFLGVFLFSFFSLVGSSYYSFSYFNKEKSDAAHSVGVPFRFPSEPGRNITYVYKGHIKCPGPCVINTFKVIPDDRILEFKINGQSVLKDLHGDLGDLHNGIVAKLKPYLQAWNNDIYIEIADYGGVFGLSFFPDYLSIRYLGLIIAAFVSLFLMFSQFYRKIEALYLAFSGLAVIAIILLLGPLKNRVLTELSLHVNNDTPLFWTIGHGITKGFKPYVDFFEFKPPMIFYLSALSLKLLGNYHLTHYISVIVQLCIVVAPILALLLFKPKLCIDRHLYAALILWAVPVGILCAILSLKNTYGVYADSFSPGFVALYIVCISYGPSAITMRDKRMWLAGVCIMLATMFKEPYYLACLVCGLVLSHDPKMFLRNFIIPSVIAGVMTVILMGMAGILIPYLTIYIPGQIGGEGSHLNRNLLMQAFDFTNIYEPFKRLSPLFGSLSIGLILTSLFVSSIYNNSLIISGKETLPAKQKANLYLSLYFVLKIFLICYLSSVAVRLRSQQYYHQYIVVIPIILTFYVCFANTLRQIWPVFKSNVFIPISCAFIFLLILANVLTSQQFQQNKHNQYHGDNIVARAKYVDRLCDVLGADRYQYIDSTGPFDLFLPFTRHLPQGPFFIQDSNFLYNRKTRDQFNRQVEQANLLILRHIIYSAAVKEVEHIIERDFTLTPPRVVKDLVPPAGWPYRVYYRKAFVAEME